MSVARFNLVGNVVAIEDVDSRYGTVFVKASGDVYPVIVQGKVLALVLEDKIKIGDNVYIEGRMTKSKSLSSQVGTLTLVSFIVSYINVMV